MNGYHEPRTADRVHVPQLEQHAYNQMPKGAGHIEPKLYRYKGTNLYQWYARPRMNLPPSATPAYNAIAEACDQPFVIEPAFAS